MKPHSRAVLQAVLVTFLWSTSWILIKIGLVDIPALTFAGLRYGLAFLFLLPLALRREARSSLIGLSARQWMVLVFYGLLFYALVQGAQFVALAYLPAATVSLVLNFTSLVVAMTGLIWLSERLTILAWVGVALSVVGGVIFFYPLNLPGGQTFGILVATIGMLANAGSAVLGRYVNSRLKIPPLHVTVVSMGIGALVLLLAGGFLQGFPKLEFKYWAILVWLALINTAFAFTLWNYTLRTLSATDSSVINNTMLIQIALMAWVFLGEELSLQQWAGMLVAGVGAVLVQLRRAR